MAQTRSKSVSRRQKVRFTAHALQSLRLRGIKKADVIQALSQEDTYHVDAKTGHIVTRMGDIRIVSAQDDSGLTVITAMRTDEFAGYGR